MDLSIDSYFSGATIAGADFRTVREIVLRPKTLKELRKYKLFFEHTISLDKQGGYFVDVSDVKDAPLISDRAEGERDLEFLAAVLEWTRQYDAAKLPGAQTVFRDIQTDCRNGGILEIISLTIVPVCKCRIGRGSGIRWS
jgi:hypothetical protein